MMMMVMAMDMVMVCYVRIYQRIYTNIFAFHSSVYLLAAQKFGASATKGAQALERCCVHCRRPFQSISRVCLDIEPGSYCLRLKVGLWYSKYFENRVLVLKMHHVSSVLFIHAHADRRVIVSH